MAAVICVVLALLVAGVVILLASVSTDRRDDSDQESAWQAFRRGWRERRTPVVDSRPVDVSLAEMLVALDDGGDAYVTTDELQETLDRARERAVGQTARAAELAGRAVPGHRLATSSRDA